MNGFQIISMSMADGETGKQLWESKDWLASSQIEPADIGIKEAHLPSAIFACKSVSRCLEFFSETMLQNLQLHQRVFLGDLCVEEWHFEFGFVIPGSTNTWNMVTEAASARRYAANRIN
ncbi:hypothetical protein BASA81_012852 [Batrachochytrium salamandrivorans]|nr:hypothetical protein BASA81_012852 [Batrachochytrium salamandrivorans]